MASKKVEYWLTDDGLNLIKGWARAGLTDKEIAENMKIAYSTFRVWRDKNLALSAALKESKDIADFNVENSLYKRANGYEYTEVTKEMRVNPKTGNYELMITKEVTKQIIPDTTAQIFWLKNRQPDKWREKIEKTDNGSDDKVVIVNDLPK
ncbi:MAG: helix-turn-helix domain-containing protein [Bacilli bacterium]